MSEQLPRVTEIDELVGDARYTEGARWMVFRDLEADPALPGVNVLIVLGDRWTVVSGADFMQTAIRLLAQL